MTMPGIVVKNPHANAGAARDTGSIPGSGRSPGEGNGNPLQYSCLENSRQRSLAGYSPGGHKELDETEHARIHTHTHHLSLLHIPEFTKAMNNESDLNSSQSLHFWSLLERAVKW